jgi:hypothetical protein
MVHGHKQVQPSLASQLQYSTSKGIMSAVIECTKSARGEATCSALLSAALRCTNPAHIAGERMSVSAHHAPCWNRRLASCSSKRRGGNGHRRPQEHFHTSGRPHTQPNAPPPSFAAAARRPHAHPARYACGPALCFARQRHVHAGKELHRPLVNHASPNGADQCKHWNLSIPCTPSSPNTRSCRNHGQ